MNLDKLKGKIKEKRKKYKECAKLLGIHECQFWRKVNGEAPFWLSEAVKLARFLELSIEEFCEIFMSEEDAKIFLSNNMRKSISEI